VCEDKLFILLPHVQGTLAGIVNIRGGSAHILDISQRAF